MSTSPLSRSPARRHSSGSSQGGGVDEGNNMAKDEVFYGTSTLKIVGIQYYRGVAHPGEFVTLQREPQNPYDCNAIRVDNLNGEKVGHIKATQAKGLSRIMDRTNTKIEVQITYTGTYTMTATTSFYGEGDQALNFIDGREFLQSLAGFSFRIIADAALERIAAKKAVRVKQMYKSMGQVRINATMYYTTMNMSTH